MSTSPPPIFPRVVTFVPADAVEIVVATLFELGATGVEQRDSSTLARSTSVGTITLLASFESDEDAQSAVEQLSGQYRAERDDVVGDEWRDGWREHFRPFALTPAITIRPSWDNTDIPTTKHVLTLDPGRAFGTGLHATTALVADVLERHAPELDGRTVLDVGCGSGILGLCALLLGARGVRATDNDPEAVLATRENAEINGVADLVKADTMDVRQLKNAYPVVVANIEARVLIEMATSLRSLTARGGLLVLSGVLAEQADAVVLAYAPMVLEQMTRRDEWVALELRSPA